MLRLFYETVEIRRKYTVLPQEMHILSQCPILSQYVR